MHVFASVIIVVPYTKSCYVALRYNGTGLYSGFVPNGPTDNKQGFFVHVTTSHQTGKKPFITWTNDGRVQWRI